MISGIEIAHRAGDSRAGLCGVNYAEISLVRPGPAEPFSWTWASSDTMREKASRCLLIARRLLAFSAVTACAAVDLKPTGHLSNPRPIPRNTFERRVWGARTTSCGAPENGLQR